MFFPYSTDAPLYYKPFGTLGLIVLNGLVFGLLLAWPDLYSTLALPYGHGLTPLNWVTSNFVHAGWLHLLGNMLFLWSFGLIVEGKLGWTRFVPMFLLIGAVECLVEQLLFWNAEGASLGASAVIFGLMAICLLWAPRNELSVFYLIGLRSGVIEISIVIFALLTLAKSVLMFQFLPGADNELLHLLGAAAGGVIGVVLLRTGRVDCEGWDLFSVMTGTVPTGDGHYSWQYQADRDRRLNRRTAQRRKSSPPSTAQSKSGEIAVRAASTTSLESRFADLVVQGKAHAAFAVLSRIRQTHPDFQPGESALLTLGRALRKRQEWNSSTQIYQELIQSYPSNVAGRLELAEILTLVQNRPSAARRLLEDLPVESLTSRQAARLTQLQTQIEALIQSGVVEIRE